MDAPPTPRLLLVDSDLRSARVLRRLLEEDGYRVEHAGDGESAIARLSANEPLDALITDVRMARAGGLQVAAFARTRRPELPVVVTTGYPERVAALGGLTPAIVILTKPIDYDLLRAALDAAVPSR
jgi:CheY-like chemotaxis protein